MTTRSRLTYGDDNRQRAGVGTRRPRGQQQRQRTRGGRPDPDRSA